MNGPATRDHDTLVREWLGEPARQTAPVQVRRPGATRRMIVAVMAVLLVVAGISTLSLAGTRQRQAQARASALARSIPERARNDAVEFLRKYEAPDGRVMRTDQGGDTVSEGQGYAMLLAVVLGARGPFDAAWNWDQQHLQRPDGLFAYHWSGGKVVSSTPATDADLDTAWALAVASTRFGDPTYLAEAKRVSSAILSNETAVVDGRLELVAGPWGRADPSVVNPSYLSPEAMEELARATGDATWSELEANSTSLETELVGGPPARLLPNWADVTPVGNVTPVGSPSTGSGTPAYGLDAQRAPVWLAAGCGSGDRALAASQWSLLAHAAGRGARIAYSLSGSPTAATVNPLGLVAAAAAASAAGHDRTSAALLNGADWQARRYHTYYGDAWVALGRILLDTNWLSACAPAVHGGT